ncbi:MAG: LamG domain-containing protein [Planctomycetota bacterium]|nr:LamG domain-containing protein [Planctomycetota bacterium]
MNMWSTASVVFVVGLAGHASASITPINWWTFDEVGSSVALDSAGTAPGALAGASAMIAGGVAGGALDVRSGGWANMGDVLPLTGTNFSMSVWIQTTVADGTSTAIVTRHNTGTFNGHMMRLNQDGAGYGLPGRASYYQSNSPAQTAVGTSTVTDGAWHHLLATYDISGNLSLYVDGLLEASIGSTPILGNDAPFVVGGAFFTPSGAIVNTFNGLVDDLQVYDRVLAADEIVFLAQNPGSAVPAPGITGTVLVAGLLASRRRRS